MRFSIRRKIILFVILPLVGLYTFFAVLDAVSMRRETTANVESRMRELVRTNAEQLDHRLREVEQIATMTAGFVENNPDLTSEQIYTQLRANLKLSPLIFGAAVGFEAYQRDPKRRLVAHCVYRDGDTVRQLDPTETGYDYTQQQQEYWHEPKTTGKASWTDPYFDEGAGDILMCTYSVPFFRENEFWGIATIDIPLEPLRELADITLPQAFTSRVLTRAGKYVYCPLPEQINQSAFDVPEGESGKERVELVRAIAAGGSGMKKLTGWTTDAREWVFYTPVRSARWGLAVSIPENVAMSVVREHFYSDLTFLAATLPLVVFTLWLVSVWISRPIVRLCHVAGEIGRGNLGARAEVAANDEIGLLAASFNEMATKLSQREKALRESEATNRAILETLPDFVFRLSRDGTHLDFYSPSSNELYAAPQSIVGKKVGELLPTEVSRKFLERIERALENPGMEIFEYQLECAQDDRRSFEARMVLCGEDTVLTIVRDVSERKKSEKEREKLIAELGARNAELERFTYTVSHDLKSPLITINGYVGVLREDLAEGNLELVEEDLSRISGAADKMARLLSDVLDLSRIGRLVNASQDVSLLALADEAIETVGGQIRAGEVQVEISPDLPVVFGDRLRLGEVLQNLIDNAAKYMGDQPEPRIEIGSRCDGDQTVFYVRDNGIGIDPRYHETVFGLFDQLDPKAEGSGIGLSLVRRIVEVHGGRVWVESEGLGHGSTFCFTLAPKGESAERPSSERCAVG